MKSTTVLTLFALSIILFGCGQKQMYYYGNYSNTLYSMKKDSDESSQNQHIKELENIIQESQHKNMKVPPGIYAELGYWYLKNNHKKEAIKMFNEESNLYLESRHLMNRLIQKANIQSDMNTTKNLIKIYIFQCTV
jgi:hypothetical protein